MNLRRKLLAFLKSQKKNTEYTELEYLESTGTQYINTGFLSNQLYDKSLYIKMKTTGDTSSYAYNGAYHISGTGLTIQFGLLATSDTLCRTTLNHFDPSYLNVTNLQKSEYTEMMITPTEYWVNGELKSNHEQTSVDKILETNNPFLIFGRSQYNQPNSITPMIICEFWIKDANGKFIQHLIPVLDKDFVPCMYDKVTGKYLYNQGDGEFKWKLPNQLEYIESDGNQYIKLDYIPTTETGGRFKVSTVGQGDMIICGSRNDTNHTRFYLSSTYSSANQSVPLISIGRGTYMYLQLDGSFIPASSTLKVPFNTVYEQYTNYKNSKVVRFVDSTRDVTSIEIPELTFTPNQPLYLFAGNITGVTNYGYKGKIYSCEITEGDKIIMYLIPAFDENLNICMYDLVSKKYFYNQGSGTFKGYFEDGSRLVAYLESTGTQYIETGLTVSPNIGFFGEAEASLTDSSFETLAGYDTYFLPFAVVPSSKRICMGYGDNTNAPTLYPLTDGRLIPSTETSGVNANLFIKHTGRFKVSLNFKGSNLWQFEDDNIKFEIGLPEVLPDDKEHTMTVFGRKYDNNITNRFMWRGPIYRAIFTDGEQVIMNLVPVVKSDNTVCMLDLVRDKYLENSGSGSFTYATVANLFDATKPSYIAGYISTNNNGNITASTLTHAFYIPCKPNTTYLITRSSVKEENQVWRAATVSETPYVNMRCPNYVGGLNNDLALTITSRENDKHLMFSEGRTMATDDLTKFTVVEITNHGG